MSKSTFFYALILSLSVVCLLSAANLLAQISKSGIAPALLQQKGVTHSVFWVKLPTGEHSIKSDYSEKRRKLSTFGRILPKDSDILQQAQRSETATHYRFLLRIQSDNADALTLYFGQFSLPDGAELYFFNRKNNFSSGQFGAHNNQEHGKFASGPYPFQSISLELLVPKSKLSQTRLKLQSVGYAFQGSTIKDFGDSDYCQVNVNCSEGDDYAEQKRSVVRMLSTDGAYQYWSTATLINNVLQDKTPYLLGAEHTAAYDEGEIFESEHFDNFLFYFNYQSPNCSQPDSEGSLSAQSINGCKLVAHSNDEGGYYGSDLLLLKLNQPVPESYNAIFAGWDARDITAPATISIHHPEGDIKKISTGSSTFSSSYGEITQNTHWEVSWQGTPNGHGVTEGGSSGSPLFNPHGFLIGTLTGGMSSCGNKNAPDWYGKLSYHWTANGTSSVNQLKPWLDPNNSGQMQLVGMENSATNIEADIGENIKLFPLPCDQFLQIIIPGNLSDKNTEITLYELNGKAFYRQKIDQNAYYQLNTSNLPTGIYLLQIKSNRQLMQKLITVRH